MCINVSAYIILISIYFCLFGELSHNWNRVAKPQLLLDVLVMLRSLDGYQALLEMP